jgi:hypothetical protein
VVAVTATVVDVTSMDVVVVSEGLTAAVVVAVATDGADSVVDVPEQPTSRAAAAAVANEKSHVIAIGPPSRYVSDPRQ